MHEYVTILIVLASMVVGVVLVIYLLKKTMPSRFTGNRHIKMIDQLSLGSKERVVLLKINKEMVLVGVSSHGMSALHVYQDTAVMPAQDADGPINRPRI